MSGASNTSPALLLLRLTHTHAHTFLIAFQIVIGKTSTCVQHYFEVSVACYNNCNILPLT